MRDSKKHEKSFFTKYGFIFRLIHKYFTEPVKYNAAEYDIILNSMPDKKQRKMIILNQQEGP